jgi:hypothetical protein
VCLSLAVIKSLKSFQEAHEAEKRRKRKENKRSEDVLFLFKGVACMTHML